MSKTRIYPVPEDWQDAAWINAAKYRDMYQQSIEQPNDFWEQQAELFLDWQQPWQSVCDYG